MDKIKKLNKKNNLIIINYEKNKFNKLKKYFLISDEIIFYIKSQINYIKKIYFLLNKLEKELKIDKNKLILIIEKNNKKNGIYYLVIKEIFRKYKKIIIKKELKIGKNFFYRKVKKHEIFYIVKGKNC